MDAKNGETKTDKVSNRLRGTSNFVPENMNLPKKGKSNKEVYLPDNTKLQAAYRTELPFKQLSNKAREVDTKPRS